eukprot:TRINITY_DN2431_c0_g1_i4.p1 TRINITY_DN2431_c0_g1~~TRINITY_DN2431_c0_g1_i4.p1  ORF type:complete len:511 (-),score=129.49 TRINITY_DN2431_c0_g1_i4:421-1953(-)
MPASDPDDDFEMNDSDDEALPSRRTRSRKSSSTSAPSSGSSSKASSAHASSSASAGPCTRTRRSTTATSETMQDPPAKKSGKESKATESTKATKATKSTKATKATKATEVEKSNKAASSDTRARRSAAMVESAKETNVKASSKTKEKQEAPLKESRASKVAERELNEVASAPLRSTRSSRSKEEVAVAEDKNMKKQEAKKTSKNVPKNQETSAKERTQTAKARFSSRGKLKLVEDEEEKEEIEELKHSNVEEDDDFETEVPQENNLHDNEDAAEFVNHNDDVVFEQSQGDQDIKIDGGECDIGQVVDQDVETEFHEAANAEETYADPKTTEHAEEPILGDSVLDDSLLDGEFSMTKEPENEKEPSKGKKRGTESPCPSKQSEKKAKISKDEKPPKVDKKTKTNRTEKTEKVESAEKESTEEISESAKIDSSLLKTPTKKPRAAPRQPTTPLSSVSLGSTPATSPTLDTPPNKARFRAAIESTEESSPTAPSPRAGLKGMSMTHKKSCTHA